MGRITRRSFLQMSAELAAASRATFSFTQEDAAPPPAPNVRFPSEPRDRLAVASYPFRRFIESAAHHSAAPAMTLSTFAVMVVQRFNLHGIEPLNGHFASTDRPYLAHLRADFAKAGVHVVNIPCDIHDSLYDPETVKRQQAIAAAKSWVDVAAAIGSPSIRIHIAEAGSAPDLGRATESLREVSAYGTQRNIVVNLENDDLVSEDAFFLVKVMDNVNSPYLRALPDFCNSQLGGVPEFNYDALTLMFRHAYNISHVKDSEADDRGRIFTTDVARTFRIARDAGYRGYFSMEWDRPGDPCAGTERLIEESLRWLAA